MLEAPELAPPAPSSACPEGPEPRSGGGVNPMLSDVGPAGSPAPPTRPQAVRNPRPCRSHPKQSVPS
jgi:hypothetical protein